MSDPQNDRTPDKRDLTADAVAPAERLQAVEQQLKRFVPRAPRLDLAAIERTAREPVTSDAEAHTKAAPTVVVRTRAAVSESRERYRTYGAVAASWLCGAAAGSIVMFMVAERSAQMNPRLDPVQGLANSPVAESVSDSVASPAMDLAPKAGPSAVARRAVPAAPLTPEALIHAMLVEKRLGFYGRRERHAGTLQVGSLLLNLTSRSPDSTTAVDAELSSDTTESLSTSVPSPGTEVDASVAVPLTRDALLRKLREEMPELVL